MAKIPEKPFEYEDQIDAKEADELEEDEEEELAFPGHPTCPRCGWHNTRPSHTKNILDTVLRTFSLHPYRCRSCGNRFRAIRRPARE